MKRIFTILSLTVSLCLFLSCQGEPGRDGRDGHDAVITTVLINVAQESWQYSNLEDNNFFYATVEMPEITRTVFEKGVVKMYRAFDFDTDYATQIEMPYVRMNELNTGTEFEDNWVFYTEMLDYEFSVGTMTIFYSESDFNYEVDEMFAPEAMQFRCAIMY